MASWSDCKEEEKLEAALRSLVAINLKHKEILTFSILDKVKIISCSNI